jgi:putative transposase
VYLRNLVETALNEVAVPNVFDAGTDRFRNLIIADTTLLRLHKFFSDEFQARDEEQAATKLYLF